MVEKVMNLTKYAASLPQPAYEASQVQQNEVKVAADQNIKMYDLMERAGSVVFEQMEQLTPKFNSILIVCGKGNNGGDGFVIARLAHSKGYKVNTLLTVDDGLLSGDALTAFNLLKVSGANITVETKTNEIDSFINNFNPEIIVDCLFGIGFYGDLSENFHDIINTINQHAAKVISVDVPSGLLASTGQVSSTAVRANITVTFIALKRGLLTGQAADYIGQLFYADLGLGGVFHQQITSDITVQGSQHLPLLLDKPATSHKGTVGMVLAIGGGQGLPGAIKLSAEAALRCGASLLSVCCHHENQAMVINGRPEIMLAPSNPDELDHALALKKAKVIIIGPGLGQTPWAKALFSLVMKQGKPCVIDADALQLLSHAPINYKHWVLTPHAGEAAKLLHCSVAQIEADRFSAVKRIANHYGGICVLKGAGSLISDGNSTWINTSGSAGMASGGMGDVLSGIIAALILQTSSLFEATRLAVYIHGEAADIIAKEKGQRGLLASDLLPILQQLVNRKQI